MNRAHRSYEPVSQELIWRGAPAERPTCVAGDIDRDGDDEFIVTARKPEQAVYWFDRGADGRWTRHMIDPDAPPMGVGGVLVDVGGRARLDFVSGTDQRQNAVYWWEQPDDPTQPWKRRVAFELPANRTHDAIVEDFDGDGRAELVIWNQGAEALFHVPLPADPARSPWPNAKTVVDGVGEQALASADLDLDGAPELIAGCSWYKLDGRGMWQRHVFTDEFRAPRLGAADFDGDGRADIFTGDMGLGDWTRPARPVQRLYLSRSDGPDHRFQEILFGEGIGTHEAQVLNLGGRPAIIGKPFRALDAEGPRAEGADDLVLWRW